VALREAEACASETEARRTVTQAVKQVAQQLGNTPAVCRACYIHPAVIEAYVGSHQDAPLAEAPGRQVAAAAEAASAGTLAEDEAAVLRLLRRHLAD
jgi:DNA topoisomerase-1